MIMTKTIAIALLLLPGIGAAQTASTQARYDGAVSQAKTGNDPERVICRSALETGSLVKRTRRCMTSAQWAARIRGENTAARDLVRDNTGLINGQ
jgi:hypothetical protein